MIVAVGTNRHLYSSINAMIGGSYSPTNWGGFALVGAGQSEGNAIEYDSRPAVIDYCGYPVFFQTANFLAMARVHSNGSYD